MNTRRIFAVVTATMFTTLVVAQPAWATVLTVNKSPTQFGFPDPFFGTASPGVYSDYGDNVTATDLLPAGQDASATQGTGVRYHYGATGGATPDITVTYIGPVPDDTLAGNGMRAYADPNHPLGFLPVLQDPVNRRLFRFDSAHTSQVVGLRAVTLSTGGFPRNVDDLRVLALDGSGNQVGAPLYTSGAFTTNAFLTTIDFTTTLAYTQGAKFLAIEFDPATNQNNFVWDDVTFAQVPEPGSFLALSLAGLGLLRRRR